MTDKRKKCHLPYGRQYIDQADTQIVSEALRDPFITTGARSEAFESELCRITGAKHAISCANGTVALHLACLSLDIGPGDLGITSPISFLASANCVEYCGGEIDFIDIDLSTLCLSPAKLEKYCIAGTVPKVVIPVDFAGVPADLPAIRDLAQQYGFYVIEDAAHSLGSVYQDGHKTYACGSCAHTDLSIFSFHPVKNITTGEGGAVMTNDDALAAKIRSYRSHCTDRSDDIVEKEGEWYYEMSELGYNYRITDIQCALGLSQLEKLARFKSRRQQIVSFYNEAFQDSQDIILPPKRLATDACPHLYPVQFNSSAEIRRKLFLALRDEGLFCQVHYIPIYWQPYYANKYGFQRGKCPEAETYYSRCISLPLFPAMSDSDAHKVVEIVHRSMTSLGLKA